MVCCLMAASHYLIQCWLVITGILWHSTESNSTRSVHELNLSCVQRALPKLAGDNEISQAIESIMYNGLKTYTFVNPLRPEPNLCHFADDFFKCNFLKKWCILIPISLKFAPDAPVDKQSTFVNVMACCRKAMSHHLNQQWPNSLMCIYALIHCGLLTPLELSSLIEIMAYCLITTSHYLNNLFNINFPGTCLNEITIMCMGSGSQYTYL